MLRRLVRTLFVPQIPSDKLVKVLGILEKNIQDGSKLSTLMNHVSIAFIVIYMFYICMLGFIHPHRIC